MSYKEKIMELDNVPGIYIFYGFDNSVLYVGKTKNRLKGRLKEHLVEFNSSVIADRTIDPREIAKVRFWTFQDENEPNRLEGALISKYNPLYNLGRKDRDIRKTEPTIKAPSEEESRIIKLNLPNRERSDPIVRIIHKSRLLYDMGLKFEIAGLTPKGERALTAHTLQLLRIVKELVTEDVFEEFKGEISDLQN